MSNSKPKPKKLDPNQVVRAHQFLYYQGRAVWSDYKFDRYCEAHGINGTGGSDQVESYTISERTLAKQFEKNPHLE